MDNLTHGLIGLAVGALRRPDVRPGDSRRSSPTDRAVLLACVIAAELPDLDILWPAPDPVTHALQAHRGLTHALVFSPVIAACATLLSLLLFRRARALPVFAFALLAVPVAHLLPDLWTGWGTRLLLPFSDRRLTLDWTLVIDPLVTLPLLAGAVWAMFRRRQWRTAILAGLVVSSTYLGARIGLREVLERQVARVHSTSEVSVFPAMFATATWRFVAIGEEGQAVGEVHPWRGVTTRARHPLPREDALPPAVRDVGTVLAAMKWARFPLVEWAGRDDGGGTVRIADLRYHLRGDPTLAFVIELDAATGVRDARLDRGGSASDLVRRLRSAD